MTVFWFQTSVGRLTTPELWREINQKATFSMEKNTLPDDDWISHLKSETALTTGSSRRNKSGHYEYKSLFPGEETEA